MNNNPLQESEETVTSVHLALGCTYDHYKGGRYILLSVGLNSSGEPVMVYKNLDEEVFVRPLKEWFEPVTWADGSTNPRFMPNKEELRKEVESLVEEAFENEEEDGNTKTYVTRYLNKLTISHAQEHQLWTMPYSISVEKAAVRGVPHILSSHAVLHAAKSVGKLAAVFEALDHSGADISEEQFQTIRAMSADLMTIALRMGNLYDFSLAAALVERVEEKNGTPLKPW